MIHEGLACFVVVDGKRSDATRKTYDKFSKVSDRLLKRLTGYTRKQIGRIHRKSKEQCPLGGRHETIDMRIKRFQSRLAVGQHRKDASASGLKSAASV
jgi:hypothetical protein